MSAPRPALPSEKPPDAQSVAISFAEGVLERTESVRAECAALVAGRKILLPRVPGATIANIDLLLGRGAEEALRTDPFVTQIIHDCARTFCVTQAGRTGLVLAVESLRLDTDTSAQHRVAARQTLASIFASCGAASNAEAVEAFAFFTFNLLRDVLRCDLDQPTGDGHCER